MVELVHPQEFDPEWEMRQAALAADFQVGCTSHTSASSVFTCCCCT